MRLAVRALLAALLLGSAAGAAAKGGEVALTFDDLPALTILNDQSFVDYLTRTLLAKLRRHHVPATGFVNEGKLDELDRARQFENLRRWLGAGMTLGKHTYSHDSLNAVGPEAYEADIVRGEAVTGVLLRQRGERLRLFRAP